MKITEDLYEYCISLSSNEPDYLAELRRETHLKTLRPHMISGPLQGQLLKMIVHLMKPQSILEIGTFTGYATLYMAAGLTDQGKIYTVEIDEELSYFHQKYFPISGLSECIETIYQDANTYIENTEKTFDLVFMDAGKKDYKQQLELLIEKMNPGGVILADNVLWKGKVLDEKQDKMTAQIHGFNEFVASHERLENMLLPLRDGLNIIRVL